MSESIEQTETLVTIKHNSVFVDNDHKLALGDPLMPLSPPWAYLCVFSLIAQEAAGTIRKRGRAQERTGGKTHETDGGEEWAVPESPKRKKLCI